MLDFTGVSGFFVVYWIRKKQRNWAYFGKEGEARFGEVIDPGSGGVGDRHVDLFRGAWRLHFILKTDKYRQRFYDAFGRGKVYEENCGSLPLVKFSDRKR